MGSDAPFNRSEKALEVMIDEHRRRAEDLLRMWSRLERIMAFWMAVVAVVFGIGSQREIPEVHYVVPAAFICVMFYVVVVHEFLAITGGYVAALETRINRLVATHALLYEGRIAPRFAWLRLSALLFAIFTCAVSIGLVAYSISRFFQEHPYWGSAYVLLVVLSCCAAIWIMARAPRLYEDVRNMVLEVDLTDSGLS